MCIKEKEKIIKFFSCFGKFQPGLFLVKEVDKDGLEINTSDPKNIDKQMNPDILKLFNTVDEKFKEILFLNSGKVRFSIRGNYYIKNEREIFDTVIDENNPGNHLLTCIWWVNEQFGIDAEGTSKLFYKKTYSSSKTSGYDYIITDIRSH